MSYYMLELTAVEDIPNGCIVARDPESLSARIYDGHWIPVGVADRHVLKGERFRPKCSMLETPPPSGS